MSDAEKQPQETTTVEVTGDDFIIADVDVAPQQQPDSPAADDDPASPLLDTESEVPVAPTTTTTAAAAAAAAAVASTLEKTITPEANGEVMRLLKATTKQHQQQEEDDEPISQESSELDDGAKEGLDSDGEDEEIEIVEVKEGRPPSSLPPPQPLHQNKNPLAKAATAAPLKKQDTSSLRDKIKSAASREALLNPPRWQPEQEQDNTIATPDAAATDAAAADFNPAVYHASVVRLSGTLNTIQGRIRSHNAYISIDDLDRVHDEFQAFMNSHPLYNPSALKERAQTITATMAPQLHQLQQQRQQQQQSKQKKRTGTSGAYGKQKGAARMRESEKFKQFSRFSPSLHHHLVNPSSSHVHWPNMNGVGIAYGANGGLLSSMPPPPPPMPSSLSLPAVPPPPQYNGSTLGGGSQHSMHSTVSTYAPHMSSQPGEGSTTISGGGGGGGVGNIKVGAADSAAIAAATAAAMASAGGGGGGPASGLDSQSAMDLLHVLSAMGYGSNGGGGNGLQRAEEDIDE